MVTLLERYAIDQVLPSNFDSLNSCVVLILNNEKHTFTLSQPQAAQV